MPKKTSALRSAKLPPEQHKKLRRLAGDHDMGMTELLVEAIDVWELHRAGKPIPPPRPPLDNATAEQIEALEAFLYYMANANDPEDAIEAVKLWASRIKKKRGAT
jgi:hypothetical protein